MTCWRPQRIYLLPHNQNNMEKFTDYLRHAQEHSPEMDGHSQQMIAVMMMLNDHAEKIKELERINNQQSK